MNERIRELADKIWAEEYWDNPATDKLLPAQLNKFAKLIIEECMHMCDVAQWGCITHGWDKQAQGCQSAQEYIAEHFGVEE